MSKDLLSNEQESRKKQTSIEQANEHNGAAGPTTGLATLLNLQRRVGNQAVQRLVAQRQASDEGFDLDNETTQRINNARSGGQPLDGTVQAKLGEAMGHDFSGVQVHTDSESDHLNRELGAKAFTTGQDIFFQQGAYDPGSSAGQELIAHELTHVVQQSSGRVGSTGSGMTVRPAGDAFEQEADAVAQQVTNAPVQAKVDNTLQRASEEEELQTKQDEALQRMDEEEELQTKQDGTVQRQEGKEEEMTA